MQQFKVDLQQCPEELQRGLAEIMVAKPNHFKGGKNLVTLTFVKSEKGPGLSVTKSKGAVKVNYGRVIDAFRALGRLLGEEGAMVQRNFLETPHFDTMGIMIDISRNAVLAPEAARSLLRHCALMGINMAILYAEDTYEVPGEPFFGYLRGRYTYEEMKGLDDYASTFGIEMFPCIQTLAHLQQILQWPAYEGYRDTDHILLSGDKKTYALLEKMIDAASAPFRSKRIHIGMDEAHGLGSGRFKQLKGERRPFDIFNEHLAQVQKICKKRGLKPMIWSDMYFRLGSKGDDYYDRSSVIPADVIRKIPKEVQLVYWDYYHTDIDFYREWIDRHRALGSDPIMAGGVWTWNHFWTHLPFSFATLDPCVQACREKNLREIFVTMWGDDGNECDHFSALPGLQYFAELGYTDTINAKNLRANFRGACEADYDDWVKASQLDVVNPKASPKETNTNISKALLWQDPLLAILDPNLEGMKLRPHYQKLSRALTVAAQKDPASIRLLFPAQMAYVLSLKVNLRRDLAKAYQTDKRDRLQEILNEDLVVLRRELNRLWKVHRSVWMSNYKPFGWEVIERRYGGLLARLESLSDRLKDYLDGFITSIPELEVSLEKLYDLPSGHPPYYTNYQRVATPSCIK